LSVFARFRHCALGPGKLCGGNNFHGIGDLLDVSNGLQSVLDLTKSSESCSILSHWPVQQTQLALFSSLSFASPIVPSLPSLLHICICAALSHGFFFGTHRVAGVAAVRKAGRITRESMVADKGNRVYPLSIGIQLTDREWEINWF